MTTPLIWKFITLGVPLVIAVVLHEVAHGWVAYKLGDPTAKSLGRITLNPLKHIDPMMTIILPTMLILSGSPIIFGGAKPVPVNPRYFPNPRRGMVYVAAAGPITNFILATIFGLALYGVSFLPTPDVDSSTIIPRVLLSSLIFNSILVNLVLGLFNLVPVPPLDGGRIAVGLLPAGLAKALSKLERFGLLIVFALLYFGIIERYLSGAIGLLAKTFGFLE